jgi:predicted pyridoxine 5'-phosphate oxidase superfamily flavin-nucleotide-binding protein
MQKRTRHGKKFAEMTDKHKEFIARQKLYFVGIAGAEGRVNVSPKGLDSLRVISSCLHFADFL